MIEGLEGELKEVTDLVASLEEELMVALELELVGVQLELVAV